jgi:hypothetical protein
MKKLLTILFMSLIMISCASKNLTQNFYASLDTAVATYNTSFEVVQQLDSAGKIDKVDKPRIEKLFVQSDFAIKAYASALDAYVRAPSMTNQQIAESALNKTLLELHKLKEILYE